MKEVRRSPSLSPADSGAHDVVQVLESLAQPITSGRQAALQVTSSLSTRGRCEQERDGGADQRADEETQRERAASALHDRLCTRVRGIVGVHGSNLAQAPEPFNLDSLDPRVMAAPMPSSTS